MDVDFDKKLQELVHRYRTQCPEDAKILEKIVEKGDAAKMNYTLFEKAGQTSIPKSERLFYIARYSYFLGYCMEYNNGIPMLEILSEWIDNGEKRKISNAVKSQKNYFSRLIEQGVNIDVLADYIQEMDMIEYANEEEKKSTGVLKRILERKRLTTTKQETKAKQVLSVPDWCIIFYYLDDAGKQQGAKIDRIIRFIKENNIRNSNGELTTKGSFKTQYYEISHRINGTENSKGEKLPPMPPERIENILHFLKKNKKALQSAKNDIVYLLDEIEENKKNDY